MDKNDNAGTGKIVPVNLTYQYESKAITGKRKTTGKYYFLLKIFLQSKVFLNSCFTPCIFCFLYTSIAAAMSGQKVINALMGRPMGNSFVVSGPIKPSIQNGMESAKTNKKNLVGFVYEDLIVLTNIRQLLFIKNFNLRQQSHKNNWNCK